MVEWWLVLGLAMAALGLAVVFNLTARLDYTLYDVILRHQQRSIDPRILIVAVDDRSLNEVGAWPWPRATHARLMDQIARGHPQSVALDLLLMQPTTPTDDTALASAIARAGNVWLPVHFEVPGPDGAPYRLAEPLAAFSRAAAGLGHVNLLPDADGTVRRIWLQYSDGPHTWQQLVARVAGLLPPAPRTARAGALEAHKPVMIQYAGGPGSFPTISAASVLRGEVPDELLAGRMVIVGATAAGLGDAYSTPVGVDGTLMPGIEIQANLLNAILSHQVITQAGLGYRLVFALLPLVLLHLALSRLPLRWAPVAIVVLVSAVLAVAVALLVEAHLWLPPMTAMLGLLALYPIWAWRRLVVVSNHISTELEKLDSEPDPLDRPRPALHESDPVARQMGLLQSAIAREQDLRHFLIDRIAQMPDAVIVTNPAGKVVLANAGAHDLLVRLRGRQMPLAHADDVLGAIHQAHEGGGPLHFADHAGDKAWDGKGESLGGESFDLRFEPQRTHVGHLAGHVIRITDTTTPMRMQRQREDILQLLSHDMRSPQASIITLLDTAKDDALAPDARARIRTCAQRTLKMADDFVHLSRAELMQVTMVDLDLASIAQEAADMLWPQAKATGVTISVDDTSGRDELLVRGDPSLLTRALVNLIDNAVKFSTAGGQVCVSLSIAQRDGQPCAEVEVRDEGLGIDEAQQAVLFEKFRRAPSGPAREIGGSGLGLAFVHTVAARLGGTITCVSVPRQGTCFTFALPLAE